MLLVEGLGGYGVAGVVLDPLVAVSRSQDHRHALGARTVLLALFLGEHFEAFDFSEHLQNRDVARARANVG